MLVSLDDLLLEVFGQEVRHYLVAGDPVIVVLLRHFENLAQIARLEPRVKETVVGADSLKFDVALSDELLLRRGPLLYLVNRFLMIVDETLLSRVRPHFKAVEFRELLHDLVPGCFIGKLDNLRVLKVPNLRVGH